MGVPRAALRLPWAILGSSLREEWDSSCVRMVDRQRLVWRLRRLCNCFAQSGLPRASQKAGPLRLRSGQAFDSAEVRFAQLPEKQVPFGFAQGRLSTPLKYAL